MSRGAAHVDGLRALFEQSPASLGGNAIGLLLIGLAFAPLAPRTTLGAWLLVALTLWSLRLLHYLRYRIAPDSPDERLAAWRNSWRALVLLQGAVWPLAVWLFWGLGGEFHTVTLILVAYTYCLASVQLLAPQRRLFIAFTSVVLVPLIVRVASDTSQAWHWQLAGVLCLLFAVTMMMGRSYRGALAQAIGLKQRTDQLAAQLRVEKAAADEARGAAEAANRAKTQFFAAASHDLRQPLHAMGLFAEALRQKSAKAAASATRSAADLEVASLVNSINQSVDALEGLFGELLDITRIDSGGVEVSLAPVTVKELFARLRLTFEPAAFEKGLALRFRGADRVLHSDSLVVERILRNLVSNAIRYSDDGGVLVACRRKPGDPGKLWLQVWDSGIGMTPASQARIFDEFYQVQPNRPLEAHQRKGLGLGLAIVKRLAQLLDAPLTLRSQPGHGSVFTLEVAASTRMPDSLPTTRAQQGLGVSLQGRRIVVVEDDEAVREGLCVLLQAWGAEVDAHGDIAGLQRALRAHEGAAQRADGAPDLAIVDYRLPEGHTGLEALALLRAHWHPTRLPAVVITGSSLGGHEEESVQHDFHLLVKPVLPNKLRAMIGFKLGSRA